MIGFRNCNVSIAAKSHGHSSAKCNSHPSSFVSFDGRRSDFLVDKILSSMETVRYSGIFCTFAILLFCHSKPHDVVGARLSFHIQIANEDFKYSRHQPFMQTI